MLRKILVQLHRWLGLTTASFLVLVGVTGAVLSFRIELEAWLAPEFYPHHDDASLLDAATLARRAEAAAPGTRAIKVNFGPGDRAAFVTIEPDRGSPYRMFDTIYLDSRTGDPIAYADRQQLSANPMSIMEFVYRLHWGLAEGETGEFILGLVALAWTVDCVIALVISIPSPGKRGRKPYMERLARVFRIRPSSSSFRFMFDWHRAGGLWLWPILLLFAWSSVYMDLNGVYASAMRFVSDFRQPFNKVNPQTAAPPDQPFMTWERAQSVGEQLMAEQAHRLRFVVERQDAVYMLRRQGLIVYRVRSSLDVGARHGWTEVLFDAYSGALKDVVLPTAQHDGNTVTTWLVQLHMADVFGTLYQAFEAVLGVVLCTLAGTGLWVWFKKRGPRKHRKRRVPAGFS
jgi:uncharacterized iron-regulated membrane protein